MCSTKHTAIAKGLEFSITAEYLWRLFLKQGKKCALSGLPLQFGAFRVRNGRTASIDRIDSTVGYIEGNVQWVHTSVNKMKKNLPDDLFILICRNVARRHPHRPRLTRQSKSDTR